MQKNIYLASSVLAISLLSGCTATQTALQHRNLEISTDNTATIFLDPVPEAEKTILVQIKNTSDQPNFNISNEVKQMLQNQGYKVIDDMSKNPHYILQANIRKVGKSTPEEAKGFLSSGYDGAISGAAVGTVLGAYSGSGRSMLSGGLLGAAVGTVADSLVANVTYTVVTDIQVSEKAANGVQVTENNHAELKQGSSGTKQVTSNEITNWKKYQTRIVSTANKVNLKLIDAEPELKKGITMSLAGIFG